MDFVDYYTRVEDRDAQHSCELCMELAQEAYMLEEYAKVPLLVCRNCVDEVYEGYCEGRDCER